MGLLFRKAAITAGLCLFAPLLDAGSITVYYNQAAWQAAMNQQSANPLTSISFASSEWSSSVQYSPSFTGLLSQSTTAASNGMTVSIDSGFSAPGWASFSSLGQVFNGMWVDNLSKYGATTFSFGDPIYGFGADFDIAHPNGLYFGGVGDVGSCSSAYDGFIGIISDQPLDSLLISWGSAGNCLDCFSNSYTLTNLEVGMLPIPEPDFRWGFGGFTLLVISRLLYPRLRHLV